MEKNHSFIEEADVLTAGVDDYVTLNSAEIEEGCLTEMSNEDIAAENAKIKAAMESEMYSTEETEVKKISAASILIAKEKDALPEDMEIEDGYDAASTADDAFVRTKTAFMVGTGTIDVIEQSEILMDRGAARLITVAEKVVEEGVDYAINYADKIVSKVCPPLKPIVDMVRQYQPLITEKAKTFVRKGITMVNNAARKCVRKAGEFVTNKLKKLASIFS